MMRLLANGTVAHSQRIFNGEGGLPADTVSGGDRFGVGIEAGLGDLDGDGMNDMIAAAALA